MGSLDDARRVRRTGLDVGFVCTGWTPDRGGVATHTAGLARELATRGHRVHVLCLDTSGEREPWSVVDSEEDGVTVRRVAYAWHDLERLASLVVSPRAEDVLHAWMAEVPCDLVHVHHATGFGLGLLRAVRDVGSPLVATLHDYWPLCPRGQLLRADGGLCAAPEPETCGPCVAATWPTLVPSGGAPATGPEDEPVEDDASAADARTRFALEMLEQPQRLLAPSNAVRETYERAGVPAGRILVRENGVEPVDVEPRADGGGLRVGVLGAVQPSKGVLELALAVERARVPGLVLEVHGELAPYHGDERYVDELRALAERVDAVRLAGPYDPGDLADVLAELDAVAAPSVWNEPFGLSVREARAAGVPVLVSDRGGLAELSGEGVTVVRAGDPVELGPERTREAWVGAWTHALGELATSPPARTAAADVRSTRELMLELERDYVETIVEATGREPDLEHPVEGREAPAAEPVEARRTSLVGRLLGRITGRR